MNTVQAFDMFEAARIGRIRASSQQALPSARAGFELVGMMMHCAFAAHNAPLRPAPHQFVNFALSLLSERLTALNRNLRETS